MYVNNYKTEKVANGKKVTFNVYNNSYVVGAVDVYDLNGNWIRSVPIEKYTDISGLYETGKTAYYLVADAFDLRTLSYTANSFTARTPVEIEVPDGGYFTISNNITTSKGVYIYNCINLLTYSVESLFDISGQPGRNRRKCLLQLYVPVTHHEPVTIKIMWPARSNTII